MKPIPKVVSFQIVQGYPTSLANNRYADGYTPDVVVLCEDGSMWAMGMSNFMKGYSPNWKRMTRCTHNIYKSDKICGDCGEAT